MLHFIKEEHQRNPQYDYAGLLVWGFSRTPGMMRKQSSLSIRCSSFQLSSSLKLFYYLLAIDDNALIVLKLFVHDPEDDTKDYFCSEYLSILMEKAGVFPEDTVSAMMSPVDLLEKRSLFKDSLMIKDYDVVGDISSLLIFKMSFILKSIFGAWY